MTESQFRSVSVGQFVNQAQIAERTSLVNDLQRVNNDNLKLRTWHQIQRRRNARLRTPAASSLSVLLLR